MTNARQQILTDNMGKAMLRLALPITLTNILQTCYQITDAFWVGRLGADAVAAVAISMPVTFLVIAMGAGLAIAGSTLSAQYMGAGRQDMVNHVAAQTMLMVAVTSIILGIIGFITSPIILHELKVTSEVYDGALKFMHTSFIGIIFVFIYAMFQSLMRGVGQTKLPMIVVGVTVILNFLLDPLFIFGYGIFPALGVMGAALATLLTQFIAAAFGVYIFLRGRHGIQLTWRGFKPDIAYIRKAFLLGLPATIELTIRGIGPMLMTFFVSGFGTIAVAAYGVGSNILQFMTIPAMGLSMAVSTLVGQNIGAKNIERARHATRLGAISGFILLSIVGVLVYFSAPACINLFIANDPNVIALGVNFIHTMILTCGGIGIQLCIVSAFRATGKMSTAMMITISQWIIQLCAAYLLARYTLLHIKGIWWSFAIVNIVFAIIAIFLFMVSDWHNIHLNKKTNQQIHTTEEAIAEDAFL